HARECGQTVVEPRERPDLALDLDVAEPLLGNDDVHRTRAEGSVGDVDVTALRVPSGARHRLSVWVDEASAASEAPVELRAWLSRFGSRSGQLSPDAWLRKIDELGRRGVSDTHSIAVGGGEGTGRESVEDHGEQDRP